ncbi:MAG TPA: DUF2336 domain-containing protein [Stellaceae bacterium]|jgi:uncharacterized protein (DUF2336 family)|nr:DUF2336 domain-containing protein [Stellaceae bacterium]
MMELLQRVFRHSGKAIDYETQKLLAQSTKPADRRRLAENTSARPEVLYYLAGDAEVSVRAAVAANEATPVQADLLLARDRSIDVRADLAVKIARLAPGLSDEAHERLRKLTYEVLEILVRDQVTRVRQVIAETLKDVAHAPPQIIRLLARDCEIVVAGPVLEFSPLLDDAELLSIIADAPIPGALAAIARRAGVGAEIAEAISASLDVDAVAALLANPSAQIREETLDRLVDHAPAVVAWHKPLVERPHLSAAVVRKLAAFVAEQLLRRLSERRDLDPATEREVAAVVRQRLAAAGEPEEAAPAKPVDEGVARARRLKQQGKLDEAAVLGALGHDRGFVRAALAVMSGLAPETVERVLGAHSPKGVTALAWKSGLGMRAAHKLQLQLGQIPPQAALKPRVDGGYPLSEEAMQWQLDFFRGMGA